MHRSDINFLKIAYICSRRALTYQPVSSTGIALHEYFFEINNTFADISARFRLIANLRYARITSSRSSYIEFLIFLGSNPFYLHPI